jgi:transposase
MTLLDEIGGFISQTKDVREIKRALAVKMILQGKKVSEIKNLLQVSSSFVSKWKNHTLFNGVSSLKIHYKGRKSYLSPEQKQCVIQWLRAQKVSRLCDLQNYLQQTFNVIFESAQSYYSLFKEAKITWKKTQKKNPAKNEALIKEKQQEIRQKLELMKEEIIKEKLVVFIIDCHLLWGDVLGYVWGRTDIRLEIPVKNEKERQTY